MSVWARLDESGGVYVICERQAGAHCRSVNCIRKESCQRRWPIMHKRCGRIAFYALREPVPDEVIKPEHFELLDGSTSPGVGTMTCGPCGERIAWTDNRDAEDRFPLTVGLK